MHHIDAYMKARVRISRISRLMSQLTHVYAYALHRSPLWGRNGQGDGCGTGKFSSRGCHVSSFLCLHDTS